MVLGSNTRTNPAGTIRHPTEAAKQDTGQSSLRDHSLLQHPAAVVHSCESHCGQFVFSSVLFFNLFHWNFTHCVTNVKHRQSFQVHSHTVMLQMNLKFVLQDKCAWRWSCEMFSQIQPRSSSDDVSDAALSFYSIELHEYKDIYT